MVEPPHNRQHFHGKVDRPFIVIQIGQRQAAHRHVTVANGFNFFHAVAFCRFVKGGDQFVQQCHRFLCREGIGQFRKSGQIREQHRHIGGIFGDVFLAPFQPFGDRRWENTQQQLFIFLVFLLHQMGLCPQTVHHGIKRSRQFAKLILGF